MDSYIGQICIFPYGFAPRGWLECTGEVLGIEKNSALYALIGCKFGGDNENCFHIPDLKSPAEGLAYYICIEGIFPQRS